MPACNMRAEASVTRRDSLSIAATRWGLAVLLVLLPLMARGQDRRIVREPVLPPVCRSLKAQLLLQQDAAHHWTLAPADEMRLDTDRIQQALDACPRGEAVELDATGKNRAFLAGPLQLRRGVTLMIARGAVLLASRDPRLYDIRPGSCGVVNHDGHGCKPLIAGNHVTGAAVMGEGVIDGRGWAPLLHESASWWDLAHQAKIDSAYQNCPRLLVLDHCDNFTLYRITLKNSPNFHVLYSGGDGFTAWGVIIDTPGTARNTDGIDPASATDVTITHCFIHAGDDDVAIKAGNAGPAAYMTIAHNHFYTGHGVSIGSETNGGVHAIRVRDLTIDGADNGIRIKSNRSRGGRVEDVRYDDVCMRQTRHPIVMDMHYPFSGPRRDEIPWFTGIELHRVRILGPGRVMLQGLDAAHRLGLRLDDVTFSQPQKIRVQAEHAVVQEGPGPVNLPLRGTDVTVQGRPEAGPLPSCQARFVPMPQKTIDTR